MFYILGAGGKIFTEFFALLSSGEDSENEILSFGFMKLGEFITFCFVHVG